MILLTSSEVIILPSVDNLFWPAVLNLSLSPILNPRSQSSSHFEGSPSGSPPGLQGIHALPIPPPRASDIREKSD